MDENISRGYCQLRPDSPRLRTRRAREEREISSPHDRCSCVYLALIVCGAGFLLPYNSFITAVDYYKQRFPPPSTIVFDMSLTYICVAFLSVVLNNLVVEALSLRMRISVGYLLAFVTLLLVAVCDVWYRMFDHTTSYILTLCAVGVVSFGCTVQQSSFYGYTSMLPRRYTQAVMTGESAAGLLVSINRILTKLLLPDDTRTNTIIFFSVSIATVLFCFIIFHATRRSQFVRFYISMCACAGVAEDQRGITGNLHPNPEEVSLVDILDGNVSRDNYGVLVLQSPTSPSGAGPVPGDTQRSPTAASPVAVVTSQQEAQVKGQGHAYQSHIGLWDGIKRGCKNRLQAAKKVWPYMISIGGAYFVTLCLFPGIETEVVSCHLHSWMPVILISIFNLFDFVGKIVASVPYEWPRARLVLCTCCRVFLVPLLMLCAAPRQRPVLKWEGWSMAFSMILGVTNGYFGSVPMIMAPDKVPDEQKELTGNIMTLSYSVGLTAGSAVAYLLDASLGPATTNGTFCSWSPNATLPFNASFLQRDFDMTRNVFIP